MLDFERSVHPRVKVSKQKITEALFYLLKEKSFEEITITDIIEATKDSYGVAIGRQTFYAHYNSKLDVIEDYFMGYFKNAYKRIEKAKETLPLGYDLSKKSFDVIFAEFEPVRTRIVEILVKRQDNIFISHLTSIGVKTASFTLSKLYREVFNLKEDSPDDELFYGIILNMSSGSIAAIISKWLVGKYTDDLDKLVEYVTRYNLVALTYSASVYEFQPEGENSLEGFLKTMEEMDPAAKDAFFYKK